MSNDLSAQLAARFNVEQDDKPAATDSFGELARIITKVTGFEEPERDTRMDSFSSLDRLEIAVRCEEKFGVRIDEELFFSWHTLGDAADYLSAPPSR
ncbi:Acyl carrier protein [Corynebacterium camporealensis]|uniref:Acyl carrier protein n=1 Tax=Corynebacterium camporealensis TaxID=161896 RepID=A0A0F6QZ33_9CORY|nr:acyl carrier protein [Corynebacterium camporealensis]AKE39613.1 acyl carrier protein [Corynebacterium camporealensis]AVH88748.1 Acyl carrier protein [Corynebacterium camporealensis]MDY5840432.1 acyl carrier protein [Corynebacterium camporealensis]